MDITTALPIAFDELDRRVDSLAPADLDRDTVCNGWTVRDLIVHCTSGNRALTAGASGADAAGIAAARASATGDGDVIAEYHQSRSALEEAIAESGALERMMPFGANEMPVAVLLGMLVSDRAVHAWDLARSLGGDETLDPDLAAFLWARVEPMADGMKMSGQFGEGASGTLGADASAQDKLLDALGRRP